MIKLSQNNLSLINISYISNHNNGSAGYIQKRKKNIINSASSQNNVNKSVIDGKNKINDAINEPKNINELNSVVENVYDIKKARALETANKYEVIYKSTGIPYYNDKAFRIKNCSSYLEFIKIKGSYRLVNTNLCRVRMCPMCAYKRSIAVFRNTKEIIDYIAKTYKRPKYLFVTLTVKNVNGEDLSKALDHLNRSWANLVRQKALKNIILGSIRTIEITYNTSTGLYHPHIHVMLHTSYDLYSGRNYISQQKLRDMWKSAAGLEYDPIIDIRRVRSNKGKEIAEIAKYAVKPINWDEVPNQVLITLDDVLHKRHMITLSGSIREAKKAIKITDIEDRKEWIEAAQDPEAEKIIYTWHFGRNRYIQSADAAREGN